MLMVPRSLHPALLGLLATTIPPVRVMQLLPTISQVRRAGWPKKFSTWKAKHEGRGWNHHYPFGSSPFPTVTLSLKSYRRKICVSWWCFEPYQSKERKKPTNTSRSHLPPLICHPVATRGLPQCLAGLWLVTNPLPATSRALGIWSGRHPRARVGGCQIRSPRVQSRCTRCTTETPLLKV